MVTAVIASVILSLSAVYLSLPPSVMPLASILTVSLSSFMGGYTVAKMLRKKGMILGAVMGVILSLILTLLAVIFTKQLPDAQSITKFAVLIVSAIIGGVLGVNTKQKRR